MNSSWTSSSRSTFRIIFMIPLVFHTNSCLLNLLDCPQDTVTFKQECSEQGPNPVTTMLAALGLTTSSGSGGGSVADSPKEITAFSILGNTATITTTAIGVTVPYGTNVTALVATFTTTGVRVHINDVDQISGTTANDFTSPLTYTVVAMDGTTKNFTVTVNVALASSKDITAFSINGVSGTIGANSVGLTLPFGTNVTALVATFTITGASVNISGVNQTSGITANNFTTARTYTVVAADGTSKDYTVTVSVALNSANDITAFSILGISGMIGANTVGVTVPFGTNPNGLVATFTTTGASVNISGVNQVSGTTANNFTTARTYTVVAADGTTKNYTVTVVVAANPAKDITAFSILGISGTIGANSVGVTVPFGTNVTALVATFTITGASVNISGVNQVSGTTANNFTTARTYTVVAADGTTKNYTVTVTVAANPNITVINSLSKDAPGTANDRYTGFAYSNGGLTVTLSQYTGATTSSGTLYATITDTYENGSYHRLSRTTDFPGGSTSDTLVSFSYSSGRLIQIETRKGGTTIAAPIDSIMQFEYDSPGNITCLRTANGAGVTTGISKYSYNTMNKPITLFNYSSGTCASPATFTYSVNYEYDIDGNQICEAWSSGIIFKNVSHNGQGDTLQKNMYSGGSCGSPGVFIASYYYSYIYSGSNQTCQGMSYSGVTFVDQFSVSGGLASGHQRYLGGNCASPTALDYTSTLTTTTLASTNTSIAAAFWNTQNALRSELAP